MRIAWCTPFAPQSAIGTYSEIIVGQLALTNEVTLFVPGRDEAEPRSTPHPLVKIPSSLSADFCRWLEGFDLHVFNMGNHSGNHGDVYELSERFPGIVILHDLVMRDFFRMYSILRLNRFEEFGFHSRYCHGEVGQQLWDDELAGRFTETLAHPVRLGLPMFKSALHRCLGVVVHSEYARAQVADDVPVPVRHLDFPQLAKVVSRKNPSTPGNEDSRVEMLTFGDLVPNKMIHATILAIASHQKLRESTRFTVVGGGDPRYIELLHNLIREHGLEQSVHLVGWKTDAELEDALARADVVINLRNPHCGESSWSLLTSLSAGVPTVVWNHGYYAEFPEGVVCKVSSEDELPWTLLRLCTNERLREKIGTAARNHAVERFNTERYCEKFTGFAEVVRARKPALTLANHVSDRLIEMGSSPIDGLSQRMADVIAGFLGRAA